MKISALAASTGVPVPTLKFYLRNGLLPPGRPLSKTQADYDHTHVERVRLIKALTDVGGLTLEAVQRVLKTLEDPQVERVGLLGAAQRALGGAPSQESETPNKPADPDGGKLRAHAWLEKRGWNACLGGPWANQLEQAWAACEQAGLTLDTEKMNTYADAAEIIAHADVNSVPADPTAAVYEVIVGTLLVDPVLKVLRRLAQQHLSVTAHADGTPPTPATETTTDPADVNHAGNAPHPPMETPPTHSDLAASAPEPRPVQP